MASATGDVAGLSAALCAARVGGAFWGAQPRLEAGRDILLAPDGQAQATAMLDALAGEGRCARATLVGPFATRHGVPVIARLCDPWHLAAQASEVRAGAGNELALVAALCGKSLAIAGKGRFATLAENGLDRCLADELIAAFVWRNPFTGEPLTPAAAIALLTEWRRLIDANRSASAIYGIAMWKRVTMDALLWDGSGPVRYTRPDSARTRRLVAGDRVLAWKSRTDGDLPSELEARGVQVGEIEDGMIRSAGLGANCVPPLSVIVDFDGAHFDPSRASGLERILAEAEIGPELIARAARLRERLVASGITKYGRDTARLDRPAGQERRVLVTGQVEDDRSVLTGGAGLGNLELLRRARAEEPGAWIIYKPHPDVEAGHRMGHVPDADALQFADEVDRTSSITALTDSVDALHVLTSLAGFEALMRGKEVVTHGVPFFAGWGLTRDLGPVPDRRGRNRTLDELVAATLLLYPRYLDPVTRLPCPAEVLVERMAAGQARVVSPLVRLREAQGRLNLMLQKLKGKGR